MKNIGARMETLRNDMNLTPQAVSSYLDIPTEELLDMENGQKNITLSVLTSYAHYSDVVKVICFAGVKNSTLQHLHLEAAALKLTTYKELQA